MVLANALKNLDEALKTQLRLALASPLWRGLPHGVQVNPRAWRMDVIELRPGHRICLRARIPWLSKIKKRQPMEFLILIWHSSLAPCLHRLMARGLNRTRMQQPQPRPRMMFYDMLSHALVCQMHPASTTIPAPLNRHRASRLVRILLNNLRAGKKSCGT